MIHRLLLFYPYLYWVHEMVWLVIIDRGFRKINILTSCYLYFFCSHKDFGGRREETSIGTVSFPLFSYRVCFFFFPLFLWAHSQGQCFCMGVVQWQMRLRCHIWFIALRFLAPNWTTRVQNCLSAPLFEFPNPTPILQEHYQVGEPEAGWLSENLLSPVTPAKPPAPIPISLWFPE